MATVTEAVIREIEEKSIKENRSMASILRERGINGLIFYAAKRRLEARNDPFLMKRDSSPAITVTKIEKKEDSSTQLSLMQTLEYLKVATENLERIFKGFKQ